ncbi:MAG: twin-arginine translocase subunit TatC [Saprospiraceae bacterium]|nr:twin-arginine translocase subunit TatC [Saprospiraceae bacterium]
MLSRLKSKPKDTEEKPEGEMTFFEHLEELRGHLFRSAIWIMVFAIAAFFAKDFVFSDLLFAPRYENFFSYQALCNFSNMIGLQDNLCFFPPKFEVQGVGFGELFTTHLKVSFFIGLAVAFPFILWEIWRFVSPGLYNKERKAARGFVFICSLLFTMGILFGYFVISPFAITFLAGYEIEGAVAVPTLASYVNYMVMFTIPVGLIFELPILVYFLSKIGLVTPEFMRTYRRHAFVVILILAAIITPPDVMTQFLVGMPLFILYELSIFISARVEKNAKKAEAEMSLTKTD